MAIIARARSVRFAIEVQAKPATSRIAERDEPRATVRDDLDQRGRIGMAGIVAEPCDAEDAVLQRIPRGGDESERADGEPASREPARASHRGAELISFSQRSSRRLRSADEPYFAKS